MGSGPYKFVSWKRGDSLEFEAFEDYFDKDHMPSIKHMTWKIIPEGSSRTIALEAGEVDFVAEVEAMDAERIESMDLATYLSTTAEGNYTAAIGNYSASNMLSYLTGVYYSKSIGASNKTRLNNPEVDALIDQACATIDEAEREEVLRQCSTLINELCPQVPLFQDVYLRAYNANLEGVEINAAGFLYFNDVKWKE